MTTTGYQPDIPVLSALRPIDADDVKALRDADDHLTFFRDLNQSDPTDPYAYVRASRTIPPKQQRVFTNASPTADRLIPCGVRVTTYTDERHRPDDNLVRAVYVVSSPRFNTVWRSVARLVKAGDTLTAHWYLGNDTGVITDAGLTVDEFHLEVSRPRTRQGVTVHDTFDYLLGYEVIGPRNPARWVRW